VGRKGTTTFGKEIAMLPMHTILYATDFSENAEPAFDLASALAAEGCGKLVVLHVERPPLTTLGGTAGVPPIAPEYDRRDAWEKLQRFQPTRPGITVEHRLEFGDPKVVILQIAREIAADLIVLGSHGRTGLRRLLMGSVAESVVRKASCPVLTVRTAAQTMLTLPADSEGSEKLEAVSEAVGSGEESSMASENWMK
jgi:nucleotide-binding universal stress UspA family protein